MENKAYIVSFGNSIKYRINATAGSLDDIKSQIKSYLEKKFPQLASLKFYDKMTVIPVDSSNAAEYEGYKEFGDTSIEEIKRVLSREVENEESVSRLNSNAPWGIGAEKDS